jgi:hypothetical protein
VTCNTGLTFLADIYTDRVLMGEGYIVTTGADGHQYLVAVPGSAVRFIMTATPDDWEEMTEDAGQRTKRASSIA